MLKKTFVFAMFVGLSFTMFATQARTIEIGGMNTLRFSVASITVKPGERVTIKLVNNTKLPGMAMSHNWVLLAAGADAKRAMRRQAPLAAAPATSPPG
ncbi:MAG: plastocyanin/azurin family copper-binding protein [Rhodanobacter sp.]